MANELVQSRNEVKGSAHALCDLVVVFAIEILLNEIETLDNKHRES